MRVRRGRDPGPFSDHSAYKPHLREPFFCRCAYCRTPDSRLGGLEGMTVDHFWPLDRYGHLRTVWTNLYYACFVCNSHYKREHPTEEEEQAGERFVNPCTMDPDKHFRLEWDASASRFAVGTSTSAGRFTVRTLGFNVRPFLRDWWLELRRLQVEEERLLADIQSNIGIAQHLDPVGQARVSTLLRSLKEQEAACQSRLNEIQEQWPFPIAR